MKSEKGAIILLSIIAFAELVFLVLFLFHPLTPITPSSTSEDFCVDEPSSATVWNDMNSDGIKSPMSDICIYARYTNGSDQNEEWYITQCRSHTTTHTSGFTNDAGMWMSEGPMAGGCGHGTIEDMDRMVQDRCKGISISIVVPDGYKPTTPTTVAGCEGKFGLIHSP